ncbi:alginate export family protein [Vibrio kasasachensis]|uniref:alginate export family protein n=1 Tax=Vibrio kasasachensis TaxID=2910248 RepID=UPI003D134D57
MRKLTIALALSATSFATAAEYRHSVRMVADSQTTNTNSTQKDKNAFSAEYRGRLKHTLSPSNQLYMDGRVLFTNDSVAYNAFDDSTSLQSTDSSDHVIFRLNEFWWQYELLNSFEHNAISVGLKRIKLSPHWIDDEIESISWQLETTKMDLQLGVGEKLSTYNTTTSINEENEGKLFVWTEIISDWKPYHHWTIRALYSNQHSDLEQADVTSLYANVLEGELWWIGAGVAHNWQSIEDPTSAFGYSFEAINLFGNGKLISQQNSTWEDRSISAFALLGGVHMKLTQDPFYLGATFAYGEGSSDGKSTFFQSGLESNKNTYAGSRDALYQFNYAFDADLSNLMTGSIFSSYEFNESWSLTGAISHYQRADTSAPIARKQRWLPLEDGQKTLGTGLDLEATYRDNNLFSSSLKGRLRLRASHFLVDDNIPNFQDETRLRADLTIEL